MHLTLHLTTQCNMRCRYCYAPPHGGAQMSLETGRRAMELACADSEASCGVVFFGGEPLLRKGLIRDLVAYGQELQRAGRGRFHYKLTTNGLALDEDFLAFAVDNDILIALSHDGVQEAHDRHRRLRNDRASWSVLESRLRALLAVRPYASIMTVVNPDTAEHLHDSVEYLMQEGARYLIVMLNYDAQWNNASFRVLRRQLRRLGDSYLRWTRADRRFYLSPFEVKIASHVDGHCWQEKRCELGRRQLSIDPSGNIYPCVQFPSAGAESEWCIGDVRGGVDEERRSAIHALGQHKHDSCANCALQKRCAHTCGCLNWQATGRVDTVSPVLCRYERSMIPIADRVAKVLYRERNPVFLHKQYNAAYPILSLLDDGQTSTP